SAGRPLDIVWTHFNKGTERYPGSMISPVYVVMITEQKKAHI
ncbi:4549_t:CDS:1, partial [Entrophospora sp. SA101]